MHFVAFSVSRLIYQHSLSASKARDLPVSCTAQTACLSRMGASSSALRRAVDSADSTAVLKAVKDAPISRDEPAVGAELLRDAVKQQLSDAAFLALLNRAVAEAAPTRRAPIHLETVRDAIDFVAAFRLKQAPGASPRTAAGQQPVDDVRFLRTVVRTPGALAFAPPALTAALPSIAGCLDPPSALRLITAHPQVVRGSGAYPTLLHYGVDQLYSVPTDVLDLACRCAVALSAAEAEGDVADAAAESSPRALANGGSAAAAAAAAGDGPAVESPAAAGAAGSGSGIDGAASAAAATLLRRVTGSGGGPAGRIGVFLADRRPDATVGTDSSCLDGIVANGMTPLMWACLRVNPAAAAVLLRHGADPTAAPAVAAPTPSARGEPAAAAGGAGGAAGGSPVARTVQLLMAPSAAPLLARLQVLRLLFGAAGQSLVTCAGARRGGTSGSGAAGAAVDAGDAGDANAGDGEADGAAAGDGVPVPEQTELRVPEGFFEAQDRGVPVHAMSPQQYRRYMDTSLAAATQAAAAIEAEAAASAALAGDERAAAALSLDSAASAGLSEESLNLLSQRVHLSPLPHHAAWRRFASHCLVALRGAPEARLQAYWREMTATASSSAATAVAADATAPAAAGAASAAPEPRHTTAGTAVDPSAEPSAEEMRHAVDRGFRAAVLAGLRSAAWRRRRAVVLCRARGDDE